MVEFVIECGIHIVGVLAILVAAFFWFGWAIIIVDGGKKLIRREHFRQEDIFALVCLPLLCIAITLLSWDFYIKPRYVYPSEGLFGRKIGGVERNLGPESGTEDGARYYEIAVPRPLDYFDSYKIHVTPISCRSYLLSGTKFYDSKRAAENAYREVRSLLSGKYGHVIDDGPYSCSVVDGKRKIALFCTDVLGRPQLYINVYRVDIMSILPYEKERFREREEEARHKERLKKQESL